MKVVYAHTDSLYVPIPSIEKAEEIRDVLNSHIQNEVFPNVMGLDQHPMDLEFEKYYQVLGVGATKNRNAGFISWKDGVHLAEPEFVCTGFSLKKIAESKLGKKMQETVIKMWIGQKTENEIVDYTSKKYNDVLTGKIPKENIIKRSKVRANRMTVKCECRTTYNVDYMRKLLSGGGDAMCENENCNRLLKNCTTVQEKRPSFGGGFAGLLYYNEHINPKDKLDDSFYHMACSFRINQPQHFTNWNGERKAAKYVAVRDIEELENYDPDWTFLAKSEIVQKVKPIFDAMGWDLSRVERDVKQQTLGEWF